MNKSELLQLLQKLNFPKAEYYILSGASLVLRGIREKCSDLDLSISEELFEQIKDEYGLTEDKKNKCGFYYVSDELEIVVNSKSAFNMEEGFEYNLENLSTILTYKTKRNLLKDQVDIKNIREYMKNQKNNDILV